MPQARDHNRDHSLSRSSFVGRASELAALHEAWDEARSGRRQVTFLSGEPGIGKTRLASEFAALVEAEGARVLQGRCDEEGLFAYQPFVEALRQCLHTAPDELLAPEASPFAPALARLLPELRIKWRQLPEEVADAETDRYRLFEAVASCIVSIATRHPLLLILEDLQWADQAALSLLRHIIRSRPDAPYLILASYRDTELGRMTPLAAVLADLRRDHAFRRISLDGLAEGEVAELVEKWTGRVAPGDFVRILHAETEGNPFFIGEVLAHLAETAADDTLPWTGGTIPSDFSIPEGIREVIGRRLSRLSPATNEMLAHAAVLGQEFKFSVLQHMVELREEELLVAMEEALQARVVVEQARAAHPHYSFNHALVRQTLYEELSLPRRQRLHLRAAQAIQAAHGRDPGAHLPALATHYRQAGAVGEHEQAIEYSRRAAESAAALLAWGEAAAHYEGALELLELSRDAEPVQRCDLLIALGSVLLAQGETDRVLDSVAPDALLLAEGAGDTGRALEACRLAIEALGRRGHRLITLTPAWRRWADAYGRYAGTETRDRVRLDIESGWSLHMTGREVEARATWERALDLARRLASPHELVPAVSVCISFTQAPGYERQRLELAEEAGQWPVDGVSARSLAIFLLYLGWAYWDWGQPTKAGAAWRRLQELAARSREPHVALYSLFAQGTVAALQGRLAEAVEVGPQIITTGDESGSPVFCRMLAPLIAFRALLHLGRADEALELVESDWRYAGIDEEPATTQPRRLVALAHLGRTDEAAALLDAVMDRRGIGPSEDGAVTTADLLLLLEAAVLLEHAEHAATLSSRLADLSELVNVHGGTQLSVARQLGAAASLLGVHDEARRQYERALEVSDRIDFRPERALSRLHLGELLLDEYPDERLRGLEHLAAARREFEEMGMRPAGERAVAALERRHRRAGRRPDGLTEREIEVLLLLTAGKRNQQIAEELVISQHTVHHHVRNILGKIGAANRAEAASYAHRQGLVD